MIQLVLKSAICRLFEFKGEEGGRGTVKNTTT
jgi:hypothetical protein